MKFTCLPGARKSGNLRWNLEQNGPAMRMNGRPCLLDAVIDTTPVWKPVLFALEFLKPGGRLVINAIRKENTDQVYLYNLDYSRHLWMEKEIKSVANVTARDVREFIRIAAEMPFKPDVEVYPFDKANEAIMDIKNRKIKGAKVLQVKKS